MSQPMEAVNGSRNSPIPLNDAGNPESVEALRGSVGSTEREDLYAAVDRMWDLAWTLDEILGDSSATTFVAVRVHELGDDPHPAHVTALADKLAERLHQEQAVR